MASTGMARRCSTASGRRTRSGWNTGSPRRSAASLTGGAAGCWPRPRGRSGWVTTASTSCPASTIRSSVGTANAGVPRKTRRIGGALLPLAAALELFDLALHEVAFEGADVGDVELAEQMIGLVQESAGEEILAGHFELFTFRVLGAHRDALAAA